LRSTPYTIEEWNRRVAEIEAKVRENYAETEDGFVCKRCGAEILAVEELHPKWMEGINGGPGDVLKFYVPYCPNCEPRPEVDRTPIWVYRMGKMGIEVVK